MGIQKYEYELSVWKESLAEEGQRKKEKKMAIIGGSDMDYPGRATHPKFITKINGTHSLTFEMPDKYFDSKIGDFIHNELVDALFNECKIKLYYKNKWYEFYIKTISDAKKFKSYMRTYTCSDVFIDELSRNGYGITFDEELYNNVEEIGTFSEEILDDSAWEYDAHLNWGDFTEYLEEKLFKIPLSIFGGSIKAHKVNYELSEAPEILNIFTGDTRSAEMGDDIARSSFFWDQYSGTDTKLQPLLNQTKIELNSSTGGYIYVPYSQLDFCYVSSDQEGANGLKEAFAATETIGSYGNKGYALAPISIDPTFLIQFIYIPEGSKVEVDESGLILNKDFTYVITVGEWNKQLERKSAFFYKFEDYKDSEGFKKKELINAQDFKTLDYIHGNWAIYYEGYLDKIGEQEVYYGKKISITDRTEVNISDEIDQFVQVYNNHADEYKDLYTSEKWSYDSSTDNNYRVCSKEETRQIVPQLARNLVQNGKDIGLTAGWEIMSSYLASAKNINATISFNYEEIDNTVVIDGVGSLNIGGVKQSFLVFTPAYDDVLTSLNSEVSLLLNQISDLNKQGLVHPNIPLQPNPPAFFTYIVDTTSPQWKELTIEEKARVGSAVDQINALTRARYQQYLNGVEYLVESSDFLTEKNAMVNFGIIGQEKEIEKGKTYVLGINLRAPSEKTIEDMSGQTVFWDQGNLAASFVRIGTGEMIKDGDYVFEDYIDFPLQDIFEATKAGAQGYILFTPQKGFLNPYIAIYANAPYELLSLELFEAYTKGIDEFQNAYFKYTGRDIFTSLVPQTSSEDLGYYYSQLYSKEDLSKMVLFEDDVMSGSTYGYKRYFIQQLRLKNGDGSFDTFGTKEYLNENRDEDVASLPLSAGQYTEDDFEIITNYIDLNSCQYYDKAAAAEAFDCKYNSESCDKVCLYQKYGYCPYRFQTEKHCRKIRTLQGEKSNRFNLTQELGKVFEIYPVYWTSHDRNGKILTQEEAAEKGTRVATQGKEDWPDKRLFYITEKGKENKLGFRYEKNLSNISRNINSDKIVTKLYVLDVDSEISNTGLCSIKTAPDNPSKDSFIIDFSYYITQGLLDKEKTEADLYGVDENDLGYLKYLGYLNTQYDNLSNSIINLSAASFTELQANLEVNLTGIETSQKKLRDLEKKLSKYTVKDSDTYINNSTYKSYQAEYVEQHAIYVQLVEDTFYTDGVSEKGTKEQVPPAKFLGDLSINDVKEKWLDTHSYTYGILGQFNAEYNQISEWKKEQSRYLKLINKLSSNFYAKYEPYLKEGTWSDGNFLTDNAYYFGARNVMREGAIPKVQYSITLVDIEPLYQEGDYDFEVADTTYVEDIGMFGINPKTGLPNRLKTIVSAITEDPDEPKNNKIDVQDFTTQFEDLFQQVSASVQSLTFNENIYKRSSNFTSQQNIKKESLQGALDSNDIVLVDTPENNVSIDWNGQQGSDINNHNNKYKLNGQGLFFSNNGGQSWTTGVGPNGINADYIRAGTLDATKVRIVDGNYIYFAWDRNGLVSYRDPRTVDNSRAFQDYSSFNKYGLSLVENGKIKLRAGYAFVSADADDPGNIQKEQAINGDTPIGFYLYNTEGVPIFATESASNSSSAAAETARISLIGEMLATNAANIAMYIITYGGVSYTPEGNITYYNLSDANHIIYSANATIENRVATYNLSASSTASPSDCAAFITYKDQSTGQNLIDTIEVIKEGGETITYNNLSYTPLDNDSVWGKLSNNQYCRIKRYSFNSDQGTHFFVIIESPSGIAFQGVQVFTTGRAASFSIGDKTTISKAIVSNNSSITGVNITTKNQANNYYYYNNESYSNLYKIDNVYYTTRTGSTEDSKGKVALYINNRTDLNKSLASSKSRLFTCCSSGDNPSNYINNIFTILKDGSLYIGGTIKATGDATSLPDEIEMNNDSYLRIKDGQLQMSFEDIVDINDPNKSIESYVSDSVEGLPSQSHYHRLTSESVEIPLAPIISQEQIGEISDLNDLINILSGISIPTYWDDPLTGKTLLALNRDGLNNYTGPALGG